MARIEPIPMDQAPPKARRLLNELVERGVEPGPMVRAMANAPALLRGYLDLTRAMKRTHLDRRITGAHGYSDEQIAEVAGLVSLQLLTGGFNLIAGIHASAEAVRETAPRPAAG